MDFFKKMLAPLIEYWQKIDRKNKIRIMVLGVLLITVIIVSVVIFTRPQYEVLYSGLAPDKAAEVMNSLAEMGIDAQLSGPTTVMVQKKDVSTAFSQLALAGVPNSGLNYNTFGDMTGMGTTDFEKRTYLTFQWQDRLQTAIVSMVPSVEAAIVNLNIPDPTKVVFSSQSRPPSASVMLKFKEGASMTPEQVDGIVELVSGSNGIDAENITVLDQNANVLNGSDVANPATTAAANLEFTQRVTQSFENQIHELLDPVVGPNGMSVMVTPKINFDIHRAESMTFTPVVDEQGIERSIERIQERAVGYTPTGDVPGTDTNGLAPGYPELSENAGSEYSNIVERINYEINQLNDYIEYAPGTLEDISVAIVLDSNLMAEDFSDDVVTLISTTLGIAPIKVAVSTLPFADNSNTEFDEYLASKSRDQLFELIKTIVGYVAAAVAIIVLLVLLMRAIRGEKEPELVAADGELAELQELAALAMDSGEDEIVEKSSPTKDKIEAFIEKSPESVTNLLRNWLSDDRKGMR